MKMKKAHVIISICKWIVLVNLCAGCGWAYGLALDGKEIFASSQRQIGNHDMEHATTELSSLKEQLKIGTTNEHVLHSLSNDSKQSTVELSSKTIDSKSKSSPETVASKLYKNDSYKKMQVNESGKESVEVHHDESTENLPNKSTLHGLHNDTAKTITSNRRISSFEVSMGNNTDVIKCAAANSSIDQFPEDLFTNTQRQHGAILLHLLGAIYFFTLLAVVCNDYFLPSVQCICEDLNISKDVAAATFMATATTTPEFFTNVISIFLIDSDMGLGTIIGSMTFNTLGVAAVAALATISPVKLDAWPITRDCILFIINLSFLTLFAWDSKITLFESICMVALFFMYFLILFQNKRILRLIHYVSNKNFCCIKRKSFELPQVPPEETYSKASINSLDYETNKSMDPIYVIYKSQDSKTSMLSKSSSTKKNRKSLWRVPIGTHLRMAWWLYTWPIKFVLTFTIPNPKTWRKLYPISFILCIVWIGVNSYMIVWMVTVMGYTISIPETVMGLTFLAAGGCMPEAISSVLAIRKGEGGFGVSNSLGANSMAILLSLGFPWLVRNILYINKGKDPFITIQSEGIEYTILSLVLATMALYIVVSIAKYYLRKCVGVVLILIYVFFITIGILIEMDILFPSGDRCVS